MLDEGKGGKQMGLGDDNYKGEFIATTQGYQGAAARLLWVAKAWDLKIMKRERGMS